LSKKDASYSNLKINQKEKVLKFWLALKQFDVYNNTQIVRNLLQTATEKVVQNLLLEANNKKLNTSKHEMYRLAHLMDFPEAKVKNIYK